MKKGIINYAYGAFLGASLSIVFGAQWNDWKYYAVMIPTIMLAEMKVYHNKEDE